MAQRIIYTEVSGTVSIIVPSEKELEGRTIQEIADKDVPVGRPYKIVDEADLPADRYFRGAWEVDESILTDGVGADRSDYE